MFNIFKMEKEKMENQENLTIPNEHRGKKRAQKKQGKQKA